MEIKKAQKYLIQISEAVQQLHDNNLAHLDLSSENVIIDKNDNIKLIDYGVCTKIIDEYKDEKKSNHTSFNTNASDSDHEIEEKKKEHNLTYNKHSMSQLLPGKPGYRAPEIETRKICDPKLADSFSLGYIAWTLLNGNMPFESAHPKDETYQKFMEYGAKKWIDLLSQSMNGWDYNNNDNIKKKEIPENAIKLLDDLLQCNIYKRKSVADLLNDKESFLHFKEEEDEKKSVEIEEKKTIDIDRKPKNLEVASSMEIDQKLIELNFQLSH